MLLEAGTTCWRVERATRAAVIIDMAEYFVAAKAAMKNARRSIYFLNWAFDPDTLLYEQFAGFFEQFPLRFLILFGLGLGGEFDQSHGALLVRP